MTKRYVAAIVAACLLAGAGGTYTYTHTLRDATPAANTVAAPQPLDPVARDITAHKASASAKGAARHAKATEARKAAVREAARVAAQRQARQAQGSGGPGPDTPRERACVGHEDELRCAGVEQRDKADHLTFAERCSSGAATSAACGREVYGNGPTSGEKQLQWACKQGYADPSDC